MQRDVHRGIHRGGGNKQPCVCLSACLFVIWLTYCSVCVSRNVCLFGQTMIMCAYVLVYWPMYSTAFLCLRLCLFIGQPYSMTYVSLHACIFIGQPIAQCASVCVFVCLLASLYHSAHQSVASQFIGQPVALSVSPCI